ncbi:MAG TPA: Ig-like domain-containing protein, partial [Verrucomicrobiae bacterium]
MKIQERSLGVGASHVGYAMSMLLLACSFSAGAATVTLVPAGATWSYDASGTDLGTAWREPGFPDSGWPSGPAQLGYGDGDEKTLLPSNPVYPCYYFRRSFEVTDPARFSSLSLEVLRDDGCVVYLNGQEVARYNMPAGAITYGTWASSATEYPWDPPVSIPNLLVTGNNVIAVEVHQGNATSSDVSLDLRLTATSTVNVSLGSPAALASGVPTPVTLSATATSPTGGNVNVAFYGRSAPPPVPDFTLVVLPDIQKYTAQLLGGTRQMFLDQTTWIAGNRAALNIAYVAQVGDITDNGDRNTDEGEWLCASAGFNTLETAVLPDGIPFGAAVGNHDQYVLTGDPEPTTLYNKYFGISRFSGRTYFRGTYDGIRANNQYQFFSASGLDFIVIYLEYGAYANPAVLSWANQLLQANPSRRGIIVSHYFIDPPSGAWSSQGQPVYNALKGNPNLFLMLCGHMHGEARRTDIYNGNTVHTLLADYQDYANGGNGFLRIMRFSPSNNQVQVFTYSPWISQYEADANSQFTLDISMPSGEPFALIQQNPGVASGMETTATWAGLQPGGAYEWYAYATDGLDEGASEVRSFTTAIHAPVATAQSVSTAEDTAVGVTLTGSDADGHPLTFAVVTGPAQGTLSGTAPNLNYTPALNYNGPDSFTFKVNDGQADSAPATVTITITPVNDSPVADSQAENTAEDTAVPITLRGSDVDGDPLTYAIVSGPAHGTLSGTAPNLIYTPALNNNGSDGFTFKVNDGQVDSA